jgi:Icc-related predicted phosphoesterase
MKILALSDIHQGTDKWKMLVETCQDFKGQIDIVVIAGDLFPKNTTINNQKIKTKLLKDSAQKIKDCGMKLILTMGNDDNQNLISFMDEEDKNGLWYHLHEKIVEIDGYEFVGMPWVPDHPFGYKYWCRAEFKNDLGIEIFQYSKPVVLTEDDQFRKIGDYKRFLQDQLPIYDCLKNLASIVKNMDKSIWLIHAPPSDLRLDICAGGSFAGSKAVLKFIDEFQPFITIHGHIHEAPEYNGHVWFVQHNKTLCIQSGQLMPYLHYAILDVENGKILNKKHSVYGS